MDERLGRQVRRRAGQVCEYCRLPATVDPLWFEIEHVIPVQHGGTTVLANLANSCRHCNRHKGPNVAGIERHGNRRRLVPLFNPRRHKCDWHFRWDGPVLIGRTAIGRVTVIVLAMNEPRRVGLRGQLMAEGVFDPSV
jgi:HNH endonuclease